jgi:hypothetical protein
MADPGGRMLLLTLAFAEEPLAIPADAPPAPEVATLDEPDARGELHLSYATHFLPEAPAHHLAVRSWGPRDSYVSGELRYLPHDDLLWVGRAGAGLDVLGDGGWDVTLGLFVGTAGTWSTEDARRVLMAQPIGGTEIGVGVEGERLIARYRWIAGIGGGPLDELLTENELTIGYKLLDPLHVVGQWIRVNPGDDTARGGVGLGVRAVF